MGAASTLRRVVLGLQGFLQQGILPIYLALYSGDFQYGALVCEAIAGGEVLLCAVMQVRQPVAQGFGAVQQPIQQGWVQWFHVQHQSRPSNARASRFASLVRIISYSRLLG